ncbi:hypothetical protein QQP08_022684, partial [Theobroma cacao]
TGISPQTPCQHSLPFIGGKQAEIALQTLVPHSKLVRPFKSLEYLKSVNLNRRYIQTKMITMDNNGGKIFTKKFSRSKEKRRIGKGEVIIAFGRKNKESKHKSRLVDVKQYTTFDDILCKLLNQTKLAKLTGIDLGITLVLIRRVQGKDDFGLGQL